MVSNCANPECGADFLYLHEGELFVIKLPDETVQLSWLCPLCAPYMNVVCDADGEVRVVARSGVFDKARSIAETVIKRAA